MPEYALYLLCAECGTFHTVPMRVVLEKSFEICLLRDVYDGEIPNEFYEAICDHECPTTGKALLRQDPGEMLLVAVAKFLL